MGRQTDEVYARMRKKCGHPPERRVKKASKTSPGATLCLDCRNERELRQRESVKRSRAQVREELGPAAPQLTAMQCGHPPERRVTVYKTNGAKNGTRCLDCKNERERAKKAGEIVVTPRRKPNIVIAEPFREVATRLRGVTVNDTGTPPPDEVLDGALCGDTGDDRFIMLPQLLSEQDREELDRWCSNCPVRMGCFEWALVNKHFIGVAGAHTFGVSQGKRAIAPLRVKEAVA